MNTLPLISVITVCYQAAEPLEKTILSVRQQYYQPLEFIVVDGGSTDGTRDIISRHQDIITRWVSEPDRGIYDAMNKGVSMATGEWVIFMNAGDTFAANDVLLRIYKKTPTPKTPTPSPSRGEGSLITPTINNALMLIKLPSPREGLGVGVWGVGSPSSTAPSSRTGESLSHTASRIRTACRSVIRVRLCAPVVCESSPSTSAIACRPT